MANFHDIRFPTDISFGSSGGPTRRTDIVTLANGFEERNALWQHSRRTYEAGYGVKSLATLEMVIAFFEARLGRLYGFRWKDYSDYKSCPNLLNPSAVDQSVGIGDGNTTIFTLNKTYASGGVNYTRPIQKPVAATVSIAINGVITTPIIAYDTGQVYFSSPPANGDVITAGFEFDVPVRFDTDNIDINISAFDAGEIPSIPIIEVRL